MCSKPSAPGLPFGSSEELGSVFLGSRKFSLCPTVSFKKARGVSVGLRAAQLAVGLGLLCSATSCLPPWTVLSLEE